MKSTGIVRKLDELGRITLPMELRRTLGVENKDSIEISVDENRIILEKYIPRDGCQCQVCHSRIGKGERLVTLNGVTLCSACINQIKEEV